MTVKQKIICALGVCVVLLYLVIRFIVPFYIGLSADRSPVISIEAENRKVYKQGSVIRERDFVVNALHENGKRSKLDPADYTLSVKEPALTGKKTDVVLTMKDNDSIRCKCTVKNERKALIRFYCGMEDLKDASAVLYSNGELCFEGKGDILAFEEYPWKRYDDMDEHPVISVTFKKGIRPESMDEWFSGMDTLQYVDSIPSSVRSMSGTFEDCGSLKKGAAWSGCKLLVNVTGCYKGCESMTQIPDLPAGVIIADHMCEDCIILESTGNLSKAVNLKSAVSMYQGCSNITDAGMAPKVETITSMFAGCINLRSMPVIPDTVLNMKSCFEGDISLQKLTCLPANAIDISSCFSGCRKIEGDFIIDCNPQDYSNLFNEAAVATEVRIQGKSKMIREIIEECNNNNIKANE